MSPTANDSSSASKSAPPLPIRTATPEVTSIHTMSKARTIARAHQNERILPSTLELQMASIMAAAGGCASHAQGIKLNDNDLVIEVFESTKKHRLETSFEISSKGSPSYPHSRGHQKKQQRGSIVGCSMKGEVDEHRARQEVSSVRDHLPLSCQKHPNITFLLVGPGLYVKFHEKVEIVRSMREAKKCGFPFPWACMEMSESST